MCTVTAAGGKRLPPLSTPEGSSTYQSSCHHLRGEGFTEPQAAKIASHFLSEGRNLNIENTRQWLALLRRCHVDEPTLVYTGRVVLMKQLAVNTAENAAGVVAWMAGFGLTNKQIGRCVTKQPALLSTSLANITAVQEWIESDLGLGRDRVVLMLIRGPGLFGQKPGHTLTPKLLWFQSLGFSQDFISRLLCNTPRVLDHSIEHYQATLSALQVGDPGAGGLKCALSTTKVVAGVHDRTHVGRLPTDRPFD